ncbi:hypothetical protein LZ32DRAFT_261261 [Colletotrichum eremochloae]|nr:hypothetical protein LZ32DRAFT_261261 [Colletotrichum eremochloae]
MPNSSLQFSASYGVSPPPSLADSRKVSDVVHNSICVLRVRIIQHAGGLTGGRVVLLSCSIFLAPMDCSGVTCLLLRRSMS